MSKLKLFVLNYDGRNYRAVVCGSQRRAMELFNSSLSVMRDYCSAITTVREQDQAVWKQPEVVFQKPINPGKSSWSAMNPRPDLSAKNHVGQGLRLAEAIAAESIAASPTNQPITI